MNIRAISLHQPYASAVARFLKRNETRHWSTNHRGPLAIHAARRRTTQQRMILSLANVNLPAEKQMDFDALPFGAYVCTCELFDVLPVAEYLERFALEYGSPERSFGNYQPGRFVWILRAIEPLAAPIPAIGRQGFWTWNR